MRLRRILLVLQNAELGANGDVTSPSLSYFSLDPTDPSISSPVVVSDLLASTPVDGI